MNDFKPLIKLFKTSGGFYFYDTNKDTCVDIDEKVYKFLEDNKLIINKDNLKGDNYLSYELKQINNLRKDGFLSEKRVKKIEHCATKYLNDYLDSKIQMLTLQVTQNCNLRCKYCAYSGSYNNRVHSNKRMNFSTAKKAIDFYKNHSREMSMAEIGFYGGEPLLEFDLIQKCVDYAEKIFEGKKIRYSITTNATILTNEIINFLYKKNFNILISLDGPREIHNKNRLFASSDKGSFDVVMKNMKNIQNDFPQILNNIGFSIVMDSNEDVGCISNFFIKYNNFNSENIISSLINTTGLKEKKVASIDLKNIATTEYEIFKIYLSVFSLINRNNISKIFLKHYNELISIHKRAIQSDLPDFFHPSGPCIPGQVRLFIDVEGKMYPCERVCESAEVMVIGDIEKGFNYEKVNNILNIGRTTENECKNCWAFRKCKLCAAYALKENKFSGDERLSYCESVKSSVLESLKNYCSLKELGNTFQEVGSILIEENQIIKEYI